MTAASRSRPAIPIGAAVRHFGALAKVVRTPRGSEARGCLAIEYDGQPGIRMVRARNLEYVAKRFETAKLWREDKCQ